MPIFLDLKFHDIPATVTGAVRATLPLKPFMLNVHAMGGAEMIRAAVEAVGDDKGRPLVLAVTILTSLSDVDLNAIGITGSSENQVLRLAQLAKDEGVDGVVCSAHEVAALREVFGSDFKLVVPGIRPTWAATDDQKRIVTPADAVALGTDYMVIGRPITTAADPVDVARRIANELDQ
jgi:orotidine-5'-phosphate decarboxylase